MSVVANVAINVDSRNAVSKLREVQQGAQATQRAFGALQSAIAGIGIASIAAQTLKAAASFNDLQTRLKLLTSEYGEYTQAQQFAAKAAKQFGLSNREAATGVADIYGRLRPLGVSLKDIQSTFNGFNTIARLSGVSAEGASAAFLQLGQALGSGQLQGDEFRSIAEQVPGLLVAVSKETGIAAKDLKDFASDGKLSADIVINALKRIESEGAGKIATLIQGSDVQKFKDLQNAVDDLSVAVGNELLPIVTPLIKDLTSLVGTIAALPDPVKNATGEIIKLIIQLLLVEKAIKAIIGLNAAFVAAQVAMAGATATAGVAATTSAGAFALYTNNARTLQAASIAATGSVSGLAGALLGLAGIGIITVGVNYVVTQVGAISGNISSINASEAAGTSGGLAAQLKGKSAAERKKMMAAAQKNLANDQKLAQRLQLQVQAQEAASTDKPDPSQRTELLAAQARIKTNQARIRAIQSTPVTAATPAPVANAMGTPVGATVGGGGGGGRAAGGGADKAANDAKRAAEQAAQVEKQIQERLRGLTREIELNGQISTIKELQFQAEMDGNKELQARLQGEERIIQIIQSTAQSLDGITDERLQQKILAKAEGEIASANQETALEMQRIENERTKSFDEIIAGLDLELALKTATTEQAREQLRLEAEIAKLRGQGFTPEQVGAITAKKTELAAPKTDQQNITEKIGTLKDEIADLTSISNIAITSAEGIGNAFAQSFQGLISGTMTAKEALGSFFKSVADMFLEMAAQIIAKQITMIILQSILKALGGAPGGGAGLSSGFDAGSASALPTDSAGWSQSFATKLPGRAAGGPVSGRQPYMVGERGPELFVPGTGGSVVNNSDLRNAMGGGGGGSPVLNMSFQSTTINGVEYVSREQLESAMAETRRNATRDGAKRGMTMTLDRIQNSSSTRRKAGI